MRLCWRLAVNPPKFQHSERVKPPKSEYPTGIKTRNIIPSKSQFTERLFIRRSENPKSYSPDLSLLRLRTLELRRCETLWSAREIASVSFSAEPLKLSLLHSIVFHIALRACEIPRSVSKTINNFFHYGLHVRPKKKQHVQRR